MRIARVILLLVAYACSILTTLEITTVSSNALDGSVEINLVDVVGRSLPGRVEFQAEGGQDRIRLEVSNGVASTKLASGKYVAYVLVYDRVVPVLVDVKRIDVSPNSTAYVLLSLLEGSAGSRPLAGFDSDGDMCIDRCELEQGTDPRNPSSIPGERKYEWPSPVLESRGQWYLGELYARSVHGGGRTSVKDLVRSAERMHLDFLAIADRNTLASTEDPAYASKELVLIPALEWGEPRRGLAIIYAPRILPRVPDTFGEAQAIALRAQSQGSVFAIANPCSADAPWQWGLGYVNAVSVWSGSWRTPKPLAWEQLNAEMRRREHERAVTAIGVAAATPSLSANGQSALFWDIELNRGLKASALGGGGNLADSRSLATPVTYIFAREKSLNALIEGLRQGRTFISSSVDGPQINMTADVFNDGTIDVGIGGSIPLGTPSNISIQVQGASGKRLDVMQNGRPIRSLKITSDKSTYRFLDTPEVYSVYRARVWEKGEGADGIGAANVLAMTSCIYAESIVEYTPGHEDAAWVKLEDQFINPRDSIALLPSDPGQFELRPRWQLGVR